MFLLECPSSPCDEPNQLYLERKDIFDDQMWFQALEVVCRWKWFELYEPFSHHAWDHRPLKRRMNNSSFDQASLHCFQTICHGEGEAYQRMKNVMNDFHQDHLGTNLQRITVGRLNFVFAFVTLFTLEKWIILKTKTYKSVRREFAQIYSNEIGRNIVIL